MDSKITSLNQVVLAQQLVIILFIGTTDIAELYQSAISVVPMNKMITGRINYPQLHSLLVLFSVSATYRCVSGSYILSFVTLPGIFSCYCLVAIAGLVSVALVFKIRATLAETQSSVSSVGVQSKGFFIVFLVI